MNAGKLRERLAFQSKTNVSDSGGGYTSTWVTDFTLWGNVNPIKMEEKVKQDQNQQQNQFEIVVRYRSMITRNMQIVWGTKTLTIITDPVNYDEKRKWLKMITRQD